MVNEEMLRSVGHVFLDGISVWSSLTLLVMSLQGRLTYKKPVPFFQKGSVVEEVEKESRGGTGWPRYTLDNGH